MDEEGETAEQPGEECADELFAELGWQGDFRQSCVRDDRVVWVRTLQPRCGIARRGKESAGNG